MVVKGFEVFLKLECRIKLWKVSLAKYTGTGQLTSPKGIRGGPAAISDDLVPGCILRVALASMILCSRVGS